MLISNTLNYKMIKHSTNISSAGSTQLAEKIVSTKSALHTRFKGNSKEGLLPKVPNLVEPLSIKQRFKTTAILGLGAGVLAGSLGLWCTPHGLVLSVGGALVTSAIVLAAPPKYVVQWHNKLIVAAQNTSIDFKNRARAKT